MPTHEFTVGDTRPHADDTGIPEPEWHRYVKTKEVDALQIFDDFEVRVPGSDGVMVGANGDYLVWDGPGRLFPVPRRVFEAEQRRIA